MKAIFKKKSRATEPASAKTGSTKPVTAKVKPVTTKVNPVTAKPASAKNKRAVTPICNKLDKSSVVIKNCTAMKLWEEACKIKTTITSNDIKYAGNKFTCYIDDFIWIYVVLKSAPSGHPGSKCAKVPPSRSAVAPRAVLVY